MADNNRYASNNGCKEAVCVDAGRVYDSCSEEHCARYKFNAKRVELPLFSCTNNKNTSKGEFCQYIFVIFCKKRRVQSTAHAPYLIC